jgi:tRNA dimethylallyltransferase
LKEKLPKLLVVTGPTGVGKSEVAIEFAKALNTEIINGDSVQVYKGFDIGSAKLSVAQQQGISHHMLSYVSPEVRFDAARFVRDASKLICDLNQQGKLPIVCGGTGLYIRALLCGLVDVPEISQAAKDKLEEKIKNLAPIDIEDSLHSWLSELDRKAADNIRKSDLQRLKRALLVYLSTGKSLVEFQAEHQHKRQDFNALVVILKMNKEQLNQRINARVKEMLNTGLIDEVKALQMLYPLNSNAFSAIGYRHAVEFLRGDYDHDKMLELLKRDTRHFAKRQRTWWRNQPRFLEWKSLGEFTLDKTNLSSLINFITNHFETEAGVSYLEIEL